MLWGSSTGKLCIGTRTTTLNSVCQAQVRRTPSIDGNKKIEKRDDPRTKKILIRLTQTFDDADFQVVSKSSENPWYKSEYTLEVVIGFQARGTG